jgi:hypothetical protein
MKLQTPTLALAFATMFTSIITTPTAVDPSSLVKPKAVFPHIPFIPPQADTLSLPDKNKPSSASTRNSAAGACAITTSGLMSALHTAASLRTTQMSSIPVRAASNGWTSVNNSLGRRLQNVGRCFVKFRRMDVDRGTVGLPFVGLLGGRGEWISRVCSRRTMAACDRVGNARDQSREWNQLWGMKIRRFLPHRVRYSAPILTSP